MCERLILDKSVWWIISDEKPGRKKRDRDVDLKAWIKDGHGTLCYTTHGKFGDELQNATRFKKKLVEWHSRGRTFRASHEKMDEAEKALEGHVIRSNDFHVLATSIACKAKILGTNDKNLAHDFKNILPVVTGDIAKLYPVTGAKAEKINFLSRNRCTGKSPRTG